MSVTQVFRCFHEDALSRWVNDREHFDEKNHPDCESIQLGVELLAVADLAGRARKRPIHTPNNEFLFKLIVGFIGPSVYEDGDYPRLISTEDVARASKLMDEISQSDLRAVYDLERLKADYLEIEEYGLWDYLGPNALEDHLIPMFEKIKRFFHRADQRKQ
jgi:hypothetical protein